MTENHAEIVCGDMLDLLPRWRDDGMVFDCCVCDPPYHLSSITKRFGKTGSAPAQHGRDGAAARLSKGFMGWEGDSGEIAFDPATWRLVFDVLPPGGRLLAFGGPRTYWKIATAIDAAGFECEDTIAWVYGQGLVLRHSRMKPAYEPIMVFRKPGPVQELNIDECRVGGDSTTGRWPSNLIHDNSPEVVACLPDAPGQLADARADGAMRPRQGEPSQDRRYDASGGTNFAAKPEARRDDSGSAARFFSSVEIDEEDRRLLYHPKATGAERVFHCTICGEDGMFTGRPLHAHNQPNFGHLESHPTVKPVSLCEHLVKLVCPPGGLVLDPFAGSGSTLVGALRAGRNAIGIEKDPRFAAHAALRIDNFKA